MRLLSAGEHRCVKGHVKVLSVFYYLLSQGASPPTPHSLNPFNSLLHPANTNTPSSRWKTSVFWGQGRGATSNLPQLSHMKHLVCSQGKQAGRSRGSAAEGEEEACFWGRERGPSMWMTFSWVWKRALWVQCAQLHWAALHTHHPKGNLSQWATILHLTPPPTALL